MTEKEELDSLLKDPDVKNKLSYLLSQYVKNSNQNLMYIIGTIQYLIAERLKDLGKESNERQSAIEDCLNYIAIPRSKLDFYMLYRSMKEFFPDVNPDNTTNSINVKNVFKLFIKAFKNVEFEIDDSWLKLTGMKNWIFKLKEFINSEEGIKWLNQQ